MAFFQTNNSTEFAVFPHFWKTQLASYILCKPILNNIHSTICYTNYYYLICTAHYILVLPNGLSVTLNMGARNWPLPTSSPNHKDGNTATSGHIVTYVTYPSSEHSSPSTHFTAGTTTPPNFYPTTYLTLYCVKPTVRPFFCRTTREDTSPPTFIPQLTSQTVYIFYPTFIPQYIFWRRIYIVSTVIYIVRRSPMPRLKRESPKKRPTKTRIRRSTNHFDKNPHPPSKTDKIAIFALAVDEIVFRLILI